MKSHLFALKPVVRPEVAAAAEPRLRRTLSTFDLVTMGVGCIVGTGVFVLTGHAAAANAGPAVTVSFAIAAIAAALGALCYSEMASIIPEAGSAYSYAYATLGELVAFIIGWDLMLEWLIGAAAVSVGWSGYLTAFMRRSLGVALPDAWCQAPWTWDAAAGGLVRTGAHLNVPAVAIIGLVTTILVRGVRESATLNTVIVFIKLVVIGAFLYFASRFVEPRNWQPFVPPNTGHFGQFGISGIFQGATLVFFSFLGFDAVSIAAQETKNPQRSLPIGILGSLLICAVLYMAVSLVLTGVVPYDQLSVPHPLAVGVAATGLRSLETVIEAGALAGLTSVLLVMLYAQPRILFAMAKDGLLPQAFTRIHPRFATPDVITVLTGALCAVCAGLLPINVLSELTSIGTLFAFILVSVGVMILRRKRPDLPRKFRVPGGPYLIPGLSLATSIGLMTTATLSTLVRLVAWMALGLIVYFTYSRHHSRLRQARAKAHAEAA